MKYIVFSVLLFAVMLDAKPYGYSGLGGLNIIGEGIGTGSVTGVGGGLGLGLGRGDILNQGALGLGLGAAGFNRGFGAGLGQGLGAGVGIGLGYGGYGAQSGYAQGGQFGNNLLNAGSSGFGSQGFLNQGAGGFHDRGHHQSKISSITQAEQSHGHDIGGSQMFNTGAQNGNGYNDYLNRANGYGSQFGQGGASQQGMFI